MCGGGISHNIIPAPGRKDSSHSKMSHKAMKLWNTAILYVVDAKLWGIHRKVINFLRMHLMIAGRWFSPHHSFHDHVLIRQFMVGCEKRLKTNILVMIIKKKEE